MWKRHPPVSGLLPPLSPHGLSSNLPAAARALADLASLENDPLLAQVEVVHALLPGLDATRSSLRTRASNLLMEGMQSQSQQDVSNALLVFAAMGALRDKVKVCVASVPPPLLWSVVSCGSPFPHTQTAVSVTTNRSRRAVDAGVGAVADASSELCWQALEATLTELQSHCVSVAHLQGLLLRTKDPLTGTVLWETFQLQDEALAERTGERRTATLFEPFWVQLAAKLSSAVTAASRRALHKNYPRLWSTLRDFVRRVVFSYEMMQLAPGFRVAESTALELLVSPLSSIEAIHIDRAKRRLTKAADALFPTPDDERTAELCRVMVRETTDARDVCSVRVAALVVDLCMRVTAEAVQQAEKHPVASLTTQTQAHAALAALVNALRLLEGCLESLLLTDDLDPLRASVVTCQAAQRAILSPLRAALERDGPQSASVFKSAVLPLFQPSPLLLATLFGSNK